MAGPLITVGMTAFNVEDCIERTIKSILAQTFSDWELIIVDDGSSDKTLEILTSIQDPRVRVLPSDGKNLKIPARRNQTIEHAKSKFYAVMDADDMSHPLRFEKQINYLMSNPQIDIVGSAMCILDTNLKPAFKTAVSENHDDIFKNKFSCVNMANATIVAKTDWIKKWKYDPTVFRGEDQELWLRSEKQSRFANLPEPLYFCNELSYISMKKYYISQKFMAKVAWKYGSLENGKLKAVNYVLQKYIKTGIYSLATVLGIRETLIKRRYIPLTPEEKRNIERALDEILAAKISYKDRLR